MCKYCWIHEHNPTVAVEVLLGLLIYSLTEADARGLGLQAQWDRCVIGREIRNGVWPESSPS
jgi:hypothetical protein